MGPLKLLLSGWISSSPYGVKRQGLESEYSPPFITEINNKWGCTSAPPHHTPLWLTRGQINLAEGRDVFKHWIPQRLTINLHVVLLRSSLLWDFMSRKLLVSFRNFGETSLFPSSRVRNVKLDPRRCDRLVVPKRRQQTTKLLCSTSQKI